MNVKKWLRGLCAAVLCVAYVGTAGAAELQKVPTAWMGAQETFPIWYAKQKGWDKEVGLDVELLYFSSGMDALSTLPAKTWVFGGMGAIPALMGALAPRHLRHCQLQRRGDGQRRHGPPRQPDHADQGL